MKELYKIKVGIEEYSVEAVDIPRIVEAMKNNDMVKLDCGVFRGNAILAVCRDLEKEEQQRLIGLSKSKEPNKEELREIELNDRKRQSRLNCGICDHTGWMEEVRGGNLVRVVCNCQNI